MKKNILIIIALCLVCILAMAGCGKKQEVEETVPTTVEAKEPTVEMTEGLVIIEEGLGIWYEGSDTTAEDEQPMPQVAGETKASSTDSQSQSGSNTNSDANKESTKETGDKSSTEPTKETDVKPSGKTTEPTTAKDAPVQTEPVETTPQETVDNCEYQQYMAMSPSEQQSYYETFASADAFFAWFVNAQQEHEAHRSVTIIEGNASLDLGDYVNSNP